MSTESETFEILQFKENGFSKRLVHLHRVFLFFSMAQIQYIYICIYSLEAYHLTFRSCGGLTFFLPNQKTFFARNKKYFFLDMENQYFFLKFYQTFLVEKFKVRLYFFCAFFRTIYYCFV